MIQISQLTKQYGDKTVLNIPSLDLQGGSSVGLVGNNGAGKTTLFSLLLDLIAPTTGQIKNRNITVNESEDWKKHTAAFIDETFLIGYLTAEEYFYFIGELRGLDKAAVDAHVNRYTDFFNDEILNQKKYLRDLSKGNQKKVGIVACFIGDPALVILDEPFANLDPTTQIRLKEIVRELDRDPNRTILISSHDLSHVTEVCSRIVLLEKGELVQDIQTSPQTLKDLEAYFKQRIAPRTGVAVEPSDL